MTPCPICRRQCRGLSFNPKLTGVRAPVRHACSARHLELAIAMIDPTQHELEAMEHAGAMGGEYLEQLGKTDLAALSFEEWSTFIDAVCTGYVEKLSAIAEALDHQAGKLRRQVTGHDLPF